MSSRPNFALAGENPQHFGLEASLTYVWDVPTLTWVKSTGGGGGGGGAATIADGADVAQGTTTDVAWVSGAGTVISLLKKIASAGGSAVSIADGADVAEGATADAAVVTDVAGTVSGKLRGLVKWAFERMPASLGQKVMASSLPVTISSDQSAVPVSIAATVTVTGGLTDTQLRATPVPVSGTVTASGPLTDVQLRASAVPVSGTFFQGTQPVSGTFFQATQPVSSTQLPVALDGSGFLKTHEQGTATVTGAGGTFPVTGTFWQATQPVSGTVTTTPPANASTNVAQVAGTTTDTNSGLKSAGTIRVVIATDQVQLTNKLLVTPDSVALPANQSVNAAQLAGTTTDTNSGLKSAGTLRVVLATDQPALTNKMLVTPDLPSGASTAAKQPALGTILAPSADVLSVQAPRNVHVGRASTFRVPGRAGTTGQKLLSLHNATGSAVTVTVTKVVVDLVQTVIKAVTVLPPTVRLWKVTVLPTNGTAMTKVKVGGSGASNASVTVLNDASADGTSSASALTATLPAGTIITQEFAPRMITAAGYEPADRMEFLGDSQVVCGALEGVVLFLDYTLATQNPITDMWTASIEWNEN